MKILKSALLRTASSFEKQGRWPSGTPQSKGGQFAPAKGGGGTGKGGPSSFSSMFSGIFPDGQSPSWMEQQAAPAPKKPPPGALPHPQRDDKGNGVMVNYPSKPSGQETWNDPKAVATFTPGSAAPAALNGVAFGKWSAPRSVAEWATVSGQKPELDDGIPFVATTGKSVGAGVIVREADGRVWLTKPTNEFGGYRQTFPKGTVEPGLSLQASAIKEAYEETGLRIRITGVLGDYERTTSRARIYVAERIGGTPADMGWESQALRLAPMDAAVKLLNMPVDRDILADYRTEDDDFYKAKAAAGAKPATGSYNPNQPRWPGGTPLGGQWKTADGDGITTPPTIAGGLQSKNPLYQKKADGAYALGKAGNLGELDKIADELAAKVAASAASGAKSSHTKWTAQVSQYVSQLKVDLAMKPKAAALAQAVTGPWKLSDLKKTGVKPGGSNPGGMYADSKGGAWLVKGNAQFVSGAVNAATSNDRANNEVLASKLMLVAGAGAPDMRIVDLEGQYGGGLGVASGMVKGDKFDVKNASHRAAIQKDFAIHAWLGNYDVLGMGYDNTIIKDGAAVNIDPGGAILFRAQGLKKESFDASAPEWDSMRKTTSEQKAAFGGMTQIGLQASAQKLAQISDDMIKTAVQTYGPGDAKAKAELASVLIARKASILQKAGLQADGSVKPSDPPPPVMAAVTPPPNNAPMGSLAKPVFTSGLKSDAYYGALANQAANLHAAGDLQGLQGMVSQKMKATWGGQTQNSKALTAYHGKLVADLKDKQAAEIAQVVAGEKPLIGAGGKQWMADGKGVLQPTTRAVKPQTAVISPIKLSTIKAAFIVGGADYAKKDAATKELVAAAKAGDMAALQSVSGLPNDMMKTKKELMAAMGAMGVYETGKPIADGLILPMLKRVLPGLTTGEIQNALGPDLKIATVHLYNAAMAGDLGMVKAAAVTTDAGKKFRDTLVSAMQSPEQAAAAAVASPATAAPAVSVASYDSVAVTPKINPPAPNFAAYKTSSAANPGHNPKIDAIQAAFTAGDEKALLSLSYGTNTYGKKQAQIANAALAALGSAHTVQAGQKANAHAALLGGAAQPLPAGVAAPAPSAPPKAAGEKPKPTLADMKPDTILSPPDMQNYGGNGSPYSSKAWKNEANQNALNAIYAAAFAGGPTAIAALKFPELDANTGAPTGNTITAEQHPAKKVIGQYTTDVLNSINDFLNPPRPMAEFNVISAASVQAAASLFVSPKIGTTVQNQPKTKQFGFWIALGNVTNSATLAPPKIAVMTPAQKSAGAGAYQKYSPTTKGYISSVQSSGAINRAIDEGKSSFDGTDLKPMVKAIYKDATPLPEGSKLTRWQSIPANMAKQIGLAPVGLAFQTQGGVCSSINEVSTKGFGNHRLNIIAGAGAKALHSHGSGSFTNEAEVTILPGQRFVLLGKKLMPGATMAKPVWDLDVLLLPPDESFVAD